MNRPIKAPSVQRNASQKGLVRAFNGLLRFGFIVAVAALCLVTLGSAAQGATIYLTDVGSDGNYRGLDVADQNYSDTYRTSYTHSQANVTVTYDYTGDRLWDLERRQSQAQLCL